MRTAAVAVVGVFWLATACRPEGRIELRADLESWGALAELTVAVFPYDATAILDSLEEAAPDPRPHFPGLDERLDTFRRPDPAALESLYDEWTAARHRLGALSDSLETLRDHRDRYAEAYRRFRRMHQELIRREADLESRLRDIAADDWDLAARAGRAADSLRRWEERAFAAFDSLAAEAMTRSGRELQSLTTDSAGRASAALATGRWWIVARWRHPENPFREYFWSTSAVVNGLTPVVAPLWDRNVILRWRH